MKAVIFDMDGVIFDSEVLVLEGWRILAERYGIEDIDSICRSCLGLNAQAGKEKFLERYGSDFPYEEYKAEASAWFHEHADGGKLPQKPGIKELLIYLKEKGILTAVASSTRRAVVSQELADGSLLPFFDGLMCGDMVSRSKPDPEIFLKAAELLGVDPKDAYVIEDSYSGILAASRAGMHPVMVPDLLKPTGEMEALADQILPSLVEVKEFFQELLENRNIVEITDFEAPELDTYARMTERQLLNRHEPEKGIFIAESPKVIERALEAGCEPISFLVEKRHVEDGLERTLIDSCPGVPVYTAEFDILTKLTGFQLTRGMLCAMYRPKLPKVEQVCEGASRLVILENVVNPTNVGAIFRSAAALNMDAVLLTPESSNPLYRRAIRVSMGTVFQIPWTFFDEEISWPEEGMRFLREKGFRTVAMALKDDSVFLDDERLMGEEKLAIIMGTEGDGLAAKTIADCDYTVRIPMSHGVDSLNVAAASAVAFWQLGKFSKEERRKER